MAGDAGNCIGDAAYVEAAQAQADAIVNTAILDTAIYVALSLWQRNSSKSIANMQDEIANRNMKLAEKVHEHAKLFWPYEKAIVDDAFSMAKIEVADYTGLGIGWSNIAKEAMQDAKKDWIDETRKMCLAPTKCEAARWDRATSNTTADYMSFGDRQAEARMETLNDLRFSRQYNALGLGKGILGNSDTFSSIHEAVGKSAGQILLDSVNSGLTALGYYRFREQPRQWARSAPGARMPFNPQNVQNNVRPRAPVSTSGVNRFNIDPCDPPRNATQADLDRMAKICPELTK